MAAFTTNHYSHALTLPILISKFSVQPETKPTNKQRQHEHAAAKARVVRAYKDGENWREVAAHNDVPYSIARRAVLGADSEPKTNGEVRAARVKWTVKVMGKLEE
ncbi:Transposase [Phytophthora megakarya]|uniref:Transposase n=1 Tax=Phytophthora megakarya TaxID=4795 RepID=A0A225UCF3_9STRA|nr:Transposase [Phytophthora megakarya]